MKEESLSPQSARNFFLCKVLSLSLCILILLAPRNLIFKKEMYIKKKNRKVTKSFDFAWNLFPRIFVKIDNRLSFQPRYSKRPLRGPYGQMLEAEMAKPRTADIALEEGLRPRRKISANLSYNASSNNSGSEPPTPCHHRTTSSPTKLDGLPGPSPELLAELLRGSSERVVRAPAHRNVSEIILLRYKLPVTMLRLHFAHFSR